MQTPFMQTPFMQTPLMHVPPLTRRRLLLAAVASPTAALPSHATARTVSGAAPALLLAQEAPADVDLAGYLVSEKYDGVRAVWDGHMLRFRSGLPVPAPGWFMQRLPAVPLDGELWLARGRFDTLSGTVRRQQPDDAEWRQLRYMLFELPGAAGSFAQRAQRIHSLVQQAAWQQLQAVAQDVVRDKAALQARLDAVVRQGGEGLVLHRADAAYATGRSAVLLKLKPLHDADAQVVGHTPGRGKHLGRLGALRVRTRDGVVFDVGTGFSDAQRAAPPALGSWVTYSHRGLTPGGVPRFASFMRMREPACPSDWRRLHR